MEGQIFELIDRGGVIMLLILIVVGGMKGWYVWNREFKEMQRDRNEWKELALTGTQLAELAAEHAAKQIAIVAEQTTEIALRKRGELRTRATDE